jgi:hypothetical protein
VTPYFFSLSLSFSSSSDFPQLFLFPRIVTNLPYDDEILNKKTVDEFSRPTSPSVKVECVTLTGFKYPRMNRLSFITSLSSGKHHDGSSN